MKIQKTKGEKMLTPGSIYFNVVGMSSFKHKNTMIPATVHFSRTFPEISTDRLQRDRKLTEG